MSTITTTPTPSRNDHAGPGATAAGQVAVPEALIAGGADVDGPARDDLTALIIAARNGRIEALRALIGHGARTDLTDRRDGNTALMYAANRGQSQAVALLIEAEADVNVTANDGWTALGAARMIGADDIVTMLRAAGARP